MLILTRRVGDSIYMPDLGIEIRVIETRPRMVRFGIVAPPDVTVLRHDAIDTRGVDMAAVVASAKEGGPK